MGNHTHKIFLLTKDVINAEYVFSLHRKDLNSIGAPVFNIAHLSKLYKTQLTDIGKLFLRE